MMKILLIEDYLLVRMSQKIVPNELYREATITEVDSFEAGISHIQRSQFDLVILDIDIPGENRRSTIERIRQIQPGTIILICLAADEQTHALEYITAGANGYLSKSAKKEEMVSAIATVLKNGRYVSLAVQERLLEAVTANNRSAKRVKKANGLSGREKEVMDRLIEGQWVKEIALSLNLRANTVSTYKARIFEKLGVSSVIELAKKVER